MIVCQLLHTGYDLTNFNSLTNVKKRREKGGNWTRQGGTDEETSYRQTSKIFIELRYISVPPLKQI